MEILALLRARLLLSAHVRGLHDGYDQYRRCGSRLGQFRRQRPAGDLPSVTFIDPDFIDFPPGYDDGAPADIARGQHFIGTILNALIQGPLWSKTLFVITYDEHGGFYDHVPPPAAVPVSAIDHYGVCVYRPSSSRLGSTGAR